MSRDVSLIIAEIINLIPNTEEKLLNEIIHYFDSNLAYKPPELRKSKYCWYPFIKILNRNIPNIETEWQNKILVIINESKF
jgi:hypothetical protein